MTHTTSEVLNLAADLIEKRGWACGTGWDPSDGDPLCIEGALQVALGMEARHEVRPHPAYIAMQKYVDIDHGLWIWNDHRPFGMARTDIPDDGWLGGKDEATAMVLAQAEVIEVLRAAAVIEAARENAGIEVSA